MYKNIILLFIFPLIVGSGCAQHQSAEDTKLSATEFAEKLEKDEDGAVQLVDVRTPKEFQNGHLKQALSIDWKGDGFSNQIEALDKSKPVFVYCLSGGRSAAAAAEMRESGFQQVYEMAGGMMEWRAENLPETAPTEQSTGMTLQQYEALLDTDKPVLVDFYAAWCAPCKKMEPYLTKIAEERPAEVKVVRIDADANTEVCKALGVSSLPVLKLYKNGETVWQHEGYIDEEGVRKQLK